MRHLLAAVMITAMAMPLAGQTQQRNADPDIAARGSGALPAGWMARLDQAYAKLADVVFVSMGDGVHATTGPAAVFYRSADTLKGDFKVSANFTQMKPAAHPEAYGLFIGGQDLQGAGIKYTYFLLRQDGKYLIKRRTGEQTSNIVDWSDHASVKKAGSDGRMANALEIQVAGNMVRFLVNGAEVASRPRSEVDVEGIAGVRVNHNLDVHIGGFKTGM